MTPDELRRNLRATTEDHHRDLAQLKQHVSEMADLALGMVADGTRALLLGDAELGRSVASRDAALDRYDLNIELETVRLVAMMQPEGPDLRTTEAILKIANCVDRIGRLGYDLSRYLASGPESGDNDVRELLRRMDERARAMVAAALEAFLAGDATRAKAVFPMDEAVDQLHRDAQKRLIELLRKGGPESDRRAFMLLGARHLERVADNACKIAEKAVYAITGERRTEYLPRRSASPPGPDAKSP
jgi:phosphate transport system protein